MSDDPARTPFEAWERVCAAGGLELKGRDADFTADFLSRLSPGASTLDEALGAATTDQFVRAFFETLAPYVSMFRAILDFFQKALVREGREQWRIKIDETPLGLEHFTEFVNAIDTLKSERDVPAIDHPGKSLSSDAHEIFEGFYWTHPRDNEPQKETGLDDVDAWFSDFRRGEYSPFPRSLHPDVVDTGLRDVAAVALAVSDSIRGYWADRLSLMRYRLIPEFTIDQADGFSPSSIAQSETDFWLAITIGYLARCHFADTDKQQEFHQRLTEHFNRFPRRKIGTEAELPALERILSMPLWRKRHELYAVWIATEIINAMDGHDYELHNEDGRIVFAFHETLVATIHSSRPKIRFYAERRQSPEDTPEGSKRQGAQPDYSLWSGDGGSEVCGLVVEVKHYKRDSPSRFGEVLDRYARAHPRARVVLVGHGPLSWTYEGISADVSGRCTTLGQLTASHLEKRAELRKLVRDYVGEPRKKRLGLPRVVAIDISTSMEAALKSKEFHNLIKTPICNNVDTFFLVDTQIRIQCEAETVIQGILTTKGQNSTNLSPPLSRLLQDYSVLLITDDDGLSGLATFDVEVQESHLIGGITIKVADVQSIE